MGRRTRTRSPRRRGGEKPATGPGGRPLPANPDIASALDRLGLCSAPSEVEGSSRRRTAGTRPMLVGFLDAAQKRLAERRGEGGRSGDRAAYCHRQFHPLPPHLSSLLKQQGDQRPLPTIPGVRLVERRGHHRHSDGCPRRGPIGSIARAMTADNARSLAPEEPRDIASVVKHPKGARWALRGRRAIRGNVRHPSGAQRFTTGLTQPAWVASQTPSPSGCHPRAGSQFQRQHMCPGLRSTQAHIARPRTNPRARSPLPPQSPGGRIGRPPPSSPRHWKDGEPIRASLVRHGGDGLRRQ